MISPTLPMTEAQLQDAIVELAHVYGWRVAHFRPAMRQSGKFSTAVQYDGKGFPDLVLARNGQVIFAEIKSERGRLSDDQYDWLEALGYQRSCNRCVCVWRPGDYLSGKVERVLR